MSRFDPKTCALLPEVTKIKSPWISILVRRLEEDMYRVYSTERQQIAVLTFALHESHPDIIQEAVELKFNLDLKVDSDAKRTPLILAITYNEIEAFKLMLAGGANLYSHIKKDNPQFSSNALFTIFRYERIDFLKYTIRQNKCKLTDVHKVSALFPEQEMFEKILDLASYQQLKEFKQYMQQQKLDAPYMSKVDKRYLSLKLETNLINKNSHRSKIKI